MATWGLILETTVGSGERKHTEAYVIAHVEGEREAALAELERRARAYTPEHPRSPRRRRLFRDGDGFLLVVDGAWQSHATRFSAAELLDDTDRPAPAKPVGDAPAEEAPPVTAPTPDGPPQPPPAPAPASATEDRDADGVPVKPAWLGRTDLP
ncbi:hypothetical protein SLAV_39510 (plasmid) [Streptomyces lavendulae subsp. lavendulae]|uniref:Uncharacterized protein n=2 Tax=Streptomycetaceae TaxID=2062 RepID=A0A068LDS0_KITAU|nr:hypothetical protein [Streptomyces lavendulae]AIE42025.1 hypothetical protein [Streptomyces lavendulae subsp. lavendulae]ATZ29665.1 hypothetical protein SLAV_39510 [Streptomyces lavendulae subsp. lavendulae]